MKKFLIAIIILIIVSCGIYIPYHIKNKNKTVQTNRLNRTITILDKDYTYEELGYIINEDSFFEYNTVLDKDNFIKQLVNDWNEKEENYTKKNAEIITENNNFSIKKRRT